MTTATAISTLGGFESFLVEFPTSKSQLSNFFWEKITVLDLLIVNTIHVISNTFMSKIITLV